MDDTIEYLTSYSATNSATKLFEPETLDISYVADGRIYSAEYDYNEYDYNKDEMDYDDDSVKAVKWSDSTLTSKSAKAVCAQKRLTRVFLCRILYAYVF